MREQFEKADERVQLEKQPAQLFWEQDYHEPELAVLAKKVSWDEWGEIIKFAQSFGQAAVAAEREQRWIPVSEKPMPFDEVVLARIEYKSLNAPISETIVCYAEECVDTHGDDVSELFAENGDDIGWTTEVVSHWMPLPDPPVASAIRDGGKNG